MDKKAFQILSNGLEKASTNQDLINFMSERFFKQIITPLPIASIIKKIQLKEWNPQSIICTQSQKIDSFFFLLEGCVNIYKRVTMNDKEVRLEIVKSISEPSLISDSLFSKSPHRSYTVIASESTSICKGFQIKRIFIEEYCSHLIKQQKILGTYFSTFLNLPIERFYKIDLYQNVIFKSFTYGQRIKPKNQVLIIYSGQCLVNFEEVQDKRKSNDSPLKSNSKRIQKYRPLLKLCQNKCLGMEQIFSQKDKNLYRFKYVVTNQNLVCISIDINKLNLFPSEIVEKLKNMHEYHMKKLQQSKFNEDLNKLSNDIRQIGSKSLSYQTLKVPKRYQSVSGDTMANSKGEIKQADRKSLERSQFSFFNASQSRFRLPNLKNSTQSSIIDQQKSLNKTQKLNPSKSSFIVNPKDAMDLKKKFCIGFELKNRCDKQQSQKLYFNSPKKVIKQPKGYFCFTKIMKQMKQNKANESSTRSNSPLGLNKDWSCYLKLPKIL